MGDIEVLRRNSDVFAPAAIALRYVEKSRWKGTNLPDEVQRFKGLVISTISMVDTTLVQGYLRRPRCHEQIASRPDRFLSDCARIAAKSNEEESVQMSSKHPLTNYHSIFLLS